MWWGIGIIVLWLVLSTIAGFGIAQLMKLNNDKHE